VMCHNGRPGSTLLALTTYNGVSRLTETDTGASIESLVRVSHIHMFGIPFILFLVGRIFIECSMSGTWKCAIITTSFLAMLLDIASWFLTKVMPGFAYLVMIGGGLMGLSLTVQILTSLYQMWIDELRVARFGRG